MRALYSSSNKMNNNRMWFVRHRRIWKHYLHAPEISKRRNATTRVQILYYTIDHIFFNIIIIIRHLRRQKKNINLQMSPSERQRCCDAPTTVVIIVIQYARAEKPQSRWLFGLLYCCNIIIIIFVVEVVVVVDVHRHLRWWSKSQSLYGGAWHVFRPLIQIDHVDHAHSAHTCSKNIAHCFVAHRVHHLPFAKNTNHHIRHIHIWMLCARAHACVCVCLSPLCFIIRYYYSFSFCQLLI